MDEIIIKVLRDEAEPLEERRLARWREASPANEERFRELSAIWTAPAHGEGRSTRAPSPEEIVARGESLRRREERRRFAQILRRRELWAAAAAVVLALGVGTVLGRASRGERELSATEFVAGAGEATTVALSDGSFVRLSAGSSVRFAGDGATREAWLLGRAFFGVAADPERPFVVHSDVGRTTVLGTRFEVRGLDHELRVIVVEGRVAVDSPSGRSAEVSKGQVAVLQADGDLSVETVDDVYALLDWEGGLLVFQGTPLRQVAEEVAAHFGTEVGVSEEVAGRTVTAWFGDDALAEVAESICLLVQAECEIGADRVRIGR